MKETVFVIGVGRSGTTLLQSILNSNSEIEFPPETHYIKRYIVPEIKNKKYSWEKFADLERKLQKDNYLSNYQSLISDFFREISFKKKNTYITASIFLEIFKTNKKTRIVGDKDPMNVNFLKYIVKAFPNSKIVHIIRDPRDVISSRIKSGWGKNNSILWHTCEYRFGINKARREGKEMFGSNYTEVSYESLVNDLSIEVKKLCKFLNVSFEQTMLNSNQTASEIIRNDEINWKENVLKPVDPSKIGKWKSSLNKSDVKQIEVILYNEIKELNYSLSTQSSFLERLIISVKSSFILLLFKLKFG